MMEYEDNLLYSDDVHTKITHKILNDKSGDKILKKIKDYGEINKKIDEFIKLF